MRETVAMPVSSSVDTVMVWFPLEKVPRVVEKVTVVPTGTGFPVVSVTVAVITLELEPSAGMLVGDAVRVMDPTPPIKETVTDWDTPLELAVITAAPSVVAAVRETDVLPVGFPWLSMPV